MLEQNDEQMADGAPARPAAPVPTPTGPPAVDPRTAALLCHLDGLNLQKSQATTGKLPAFKRGEKKQRSSTSSLQLAIRSTAVPPPTTFELLRKAANATPKAPRQTRSTGPSALESLQIDKVYGKILGTYKAVERKRSQALAAHREAAEVNQSALLASDARSACREASLDVQEAKSHHAALAEELHSLTTEKAERFKGRPDSDDDMMLLGRIEDRIIKIHALLPSAVKSLEEAEDKLQKAKSEYTADW